MKTISKHVCAVLGLLGLAVNFVHAQGTLGKGLAKLAAKKPVATSSLLDGSLQRAILQADIRDFSFYKHLPGYSPILGYYTKKTSQALSVDVGVFSTDLLGNPHVQIAPKRLRNSAQEPGVMLLNQTSFPQVVQAMYLWRLANPGVPLRKNSALVQRANELLAQSGDSMKLVDGKERPAYLFMQRLLNPSFTPRTYTELAEQTRKYPKHVSLDEFGFPVPTEESSHARMLDNYLMLGQQPMMNLFDSRNLHKGLREKMYTPFVLTREEQLAAEQLLALRQAAFKIPAKPTVRQLLDIAYNQLESHTVVYDTRQADQFFAYSAFPHYRSTALYRHIKQVLEQAEASVWRESRDISHLIVLDAVMDGLAEDWQNVAAINRAFDAFEKLCRETPFTSKNAEHLKRLHRSMQKAAGIWEYMPDSKLPRAEFDKLLTDEWVFLRERAEHFANLQVDKLITRL